MFACSDHRKGFAITFENGWTVSVQWRSGNYAHAAGKSAETWAWHSAHNKEDEDVRGWQSPEQVLAYMNEVAARVARCQRKPRTAAETRSAIISGEL